MMRMRKGVPPGAWQTFAIALWPWPCTSRAKHALMPHTSTGTSCLLVLTDRDNINIDYIKHV